jgi:hypothetical protein
MFINKAALERNQTKLKPKNAIQNLSPSYRISPKLVKKLGSSYLRRERRDKSNMRLSLILKIHASGADATGVEKSLNVRGTSRLNLDHRTWQRCRYL